MNMITSEKSTKQEFAAIGDIVEFKRKGRNYKGRVTIIRELSCIIDLSEDDAFDLNYETPKTVVRHGNYEIIEK